MKKLVFVVVSVLLVLIHSVRAAEPVITFKDVDWAPACGGSNIRVTRVDGKIVNVEAFLERSFDSAVWQCHYVDGRVSSVLYTHYKLNDKWAVDEEPPKFLCDRVLVFPIKNHKLDNIPKELREELIEILAKAQKGKET